jgi:hypothetical protein
VSSRCLLTEVIAFKSRHKASGAGLKHGSPDTCALSATIASYNRHQRCPCLITCTDDVMPVTGHLGRCGVLVQIIWRVLLRLQPTSGWDHTHWSQTTMPAAEKL